MNNDSDDFKQQFISLIGNIQKVVATIDDSSQLNEILWVSQESLRAQINGKDEKNKELLPLLTKELKFLNDMYERKKQDKGNWKKWLKAVGIVLESIGKCLNISLVDIVGEVVRIASIFSICGCSNKK